MVALLALVAAPSPAPKPLFAIKGESAFIDDGFALSPQGDRLAYVRTNGADVEVKRESIVDWIRRPPDFSDSRYEAVRSLAERGAESAVGELEKFARDPVRGVRLAALEGLGSLARVRSLPFLCSQASAHCL